MTLIPNKIKREALDTQDIGLDSLEERVALLENNSLDMDRLADAMVSDEVVCAAADGQTTTFNLNHLPIAKSVKLECDGQDMTLGKDFAFGQIVNDKLDTAIEENPQQVIFLEPPTAGSAITASYLKAST